MKRVFWTQWLLRVSCGLSILSALAALPVGASPGIRYVAPGGSCGGATPCYGEIQAAVNAAVDGDEIRVAEGTYSQVSSGSGITAVVSRSKSWSASSATASASSAQTSFPTTQLRGLGSSSRCR